MNAIADSRADFARAISYTSKIFMTPIARLLISLTHSVFDKNVTEFLIKKFRNFFVFKFVPDGTKLRLNILNCLP